MEISMKLQAFGRIQVKTGKRYIFLRPDEIDCIEAERNYVKIQCHGESFLCRQTLNAIESKLADSRLVRVNRSAMVNIDRIRELRLDGACRYQVVMDGGRSWNWGRTFRSNLQRVITS